jgi:Na+/melibiose symporter-like transporter
MKMLYLIVFIVMHDGTHDVTAMPVKTCPPQELTEKYYNEHQALGAFKQWAALCATINFTNPEKGI